MSRYIIKRLLFSQNLKQIDFYDFLDLSEDLIYITKLSLQIKYT